MKLRINLIFPVRCELSAPNSAKPNFPHRLVWRHFQTPPRYIAGSEHIPVPENSKAFASGKKKNYHKVWAQNLQYECLEALNPITYIQFMTISHAAIHSHLFIQSTNIC